MESSVWRGCEQEATNSLWDWSIKATIKVLGGGGEATLLQKDPSPTNQFKVRSLIYQKPEAPWGLRLFTIRAMGAGC